MQIVFEKSFPKLLSTKSFIDYLIRNPKEFKQYVYTPANKAKKMLLRNAKNESLRSKLQKVLYNGLPESFCGELCAVLPRQIATPNFETRRFLSIVDLLGDLTPIIPEFTDDTFVSRNSFKKSLISIEFAGRTQVESISVADINQCEGTKLKNITTFWGQPLTEFYMDFFKDTFKLLPKRHFIDNSDWLHSYGAHANDFYYYYLLLFVQNALLFEDFDLTDEREVRFIRDRFLPIFMKITETFGIKPLIVHLEPSQFEGLDFWFRHPLSSLEYVRAKLK